jgi:hypothetical protein
VFVYSKSAILCSLCLCLAGAACTSSGGAGNLERFREQRRRQTADTVARLSADEGGRVMLKALEAHGGLEAWFRTRSSVSVWEYTRVGSGRSFTSKLFGERGGQRVYQELAYFDPTGAKIGSGRFAWNGGSGWLEMEGAVTHPDRLRHRAAATFYLERVPFVFALQNIEYTLLEPKDLEGVPHDRIRLSIKGGVADARFVVFINQLTGRVSAVRYAFPVDPPQAGIDSLKDGLIRYEEFFKVDGLTLPTKMSLYSLQDGAEQQQGYIATCREITFREFFDASLLKRPPGAIVISDTTAAVHQP